MRSTTTKHANGRRRHAIPSELPAEAVTALVDLRERKPLNLSPLAVVPGTLQTGDYTIQKLEHVIAVERKSLDDLLRCCGTDRERFEREVERLLAFPTRCLVVEATWPQIEAGRWRGKMKPAAVLGSLLGWQAAGLPVLMAGDHERAGRYVARLLYIAARRRWQEARSFGNAIIEAKANGRQASDENHQEEQHEEICSHA